MYQALYRKWRPKTFDDVVGQGHITQTLKNQVGTGRLSHAYLFIGTRGTGKTTCAKILAKAVNCENPENGNPCNKCRICRGIDDGSILDVVEMDAASNNGVDNVRALRDEAIFSPAVAKKRVYIIDEVHMLSTAAFNALLKILEEPPEHLMFILATTELQKVPATILSRCQRHSFKRLDMQSIMQRLDYVARQEGIDLRPDGNELIARLSEGGMRDALSLLDQCAGRKTVDADTVYSAMGLAGKYNIINMLRSISSADTQGALELFQRLWQDGKDPASLLGELSALLRDVLIKKVAPRGGAELMTGGYDEKTLGEFSVAFSPGELINAIHIIQSALASMKNGQARIVCELCIISLCEKGVGDDLPLLRERVEKLERLFRGGAPRLPAEEPRPADAEKNVDWKDGLPEASPIRDEIKPAPDFGGVSDAEPAPFEIPKTEARERTERKPVKPVYPAVKVQAPPAAADADWDGILKAIRGKLPPGIFMLISDPMQMHGHLAGSELTLYAANDFAMNNVNRPDVTARIAAAAGQSTGGSIHVMVKRAEEEPEARGTQPNGTKLDELGKFDIVTIK